MKTYLSSELSCRFGNQNADSLIVDLGSATSVINDVVQNMAMSCIVVSSLDDLSNQISDLNGGTVAIVSSIIAGNAIERTAYSLVKDTNLCGHWEAFTGNYSADKVYFSKNMQFAGNYTLGNRKTSLTSTVVYDAGLSSLQSIMFDMFTKRIQPTKTNPTVSLTAAQQNSYEVGTEVTATYSASCTKGAYTYDRDTGVQITGWSVADTAGHTNTTAEGSFPAISVIDSTNYNITATAKYTAGNIAKDNLGDNSNPIVQITAGQASKSTSTSITGYRKFFMFCSELAVSELGLDSDKIRGAESSYSWKSKFISDNIAVLPTKYSTSGYVVNPTALAMVIAVPTDFNKRPFGQNGAEEINYKLDTTEIDVDGATRGKNQKKYKIWYAQYSSPMQAKTIILTWK